MAKKHSGKRGRRAPKTVLWQPDLDQTRSAVLNSLSSTDAPRGYRHASQAQDLGQAAFYMHRSLGGMRVPGYNLMAPRSRRQAKQARSAKVARLRTTTSVRRAGDNSRIPNAIDAVTCTRTSRRCSSLRTWTV